MSYAMLQAVKTPGLTPRERLVYTYIVGRANGTRITWPTVEEMQNDLGIKSRHGICSATGRLTELGLIEVKRQMRGRNQYAVLDPDGWLYQPPPELPLEQQIARKRRTQRAQKHSVSTTRDVQKTAHRAPEKDVQKTTHRVDVAEPNDVQETAHRDVQKTAHLKYPRVIQETQSPGLTLNPNFQDGSPPPPVRADARAAAADEQRICVDAWNAMADRSGLARIKVLSARRAAALSARLREHGLAGALEAIAAVGASDFCHGKGRTGWQADFDFLLQSKSMARAREGFYANRAATSGMGSFDQIRHEWNLPSFLTPEFDDDDDAPPYSALEQVR